MYTPVISDTFLESFDRLDSKSRKAVRQSLRQLSSGLKGNGLQVHDLDRTNCDRSFKSARINRDLRVIFSQQGDKLLLLYVDHHDKAYQWAEGKFLHTNKFGSLYIHDTNILLAEKKAEETPPFYFNYFEQKTPLLEKRNISKKDLIKLGLHEHDAEELMRITDEDQFIEYISAFPEELQEALLDLAAGTKTITQVYNELTDENVHNPDHSIELALNHKDSKRRFRMLNNMEELEHILEEKFERWKLFLHPQQEFLVKQNFKGPVLVEGGPGTGKTIVGIHRAVYLAEHVYPEADGKKILFCTFSRKLALYIEEKIHQLLRQRMVTNNIQVIGVDQLITQLVREYQLTDALLLPDEVENLVLETYREMEPPEPLSFYQKEFREVIQKYQIRSLEEYLRVDRSGLGKALLPGVRSRIWKFFDVLLAKKTARKLIDFEDQAYLVYQAIKQGVILPLFDSIIIDEAQDLSPMKLRVLSLLVRTKENNLFLLSDQNQRIFNFTSWKKDAHINVVGRTFYLNLNYRTTKQIREYADQQFIRSQMVKDHIKEYKSLFSGPEPLVKGFPDKQQQYSFIVKRIKGLIEQEQIQPHEIGIITPIDREVIQYLLETDGIPCTHLTRDVFPKEGNGVGISTLHGCKGLEFRIVFIPNYTNIASTQEEDDYYNELKTKQLECLKYVASTRAREELIVTYVS
jgi:mRNA-degrading endonuclease RelE of RelBE toxin-antitoxin system